MYIHIVICDVNFNTGVILEVAMAKCGGKEAFESAAARGDVMKCLSKDKKHYLYYFPEDRLPTVHMYSDHHVSTLNDAPVHQTVYEAA